MPWASRCFWLSSCWCRWWCPIWVCEAPEVYPCRQELLPRIRQIFSAASELEGVSGASVYPNCVARDNRYDVLIVLDMAPEALPVYDASAMHHLWKEEFGPLLAQKAIFDFEA